MSAFEVTWLHKDSLAFTRHITDPANDIINLAASSQVAPQTLSELHYKQPNRSSPR